MITVIEQNVATNFNTMQDIYMQQSRVAKFDCSWEEYINSYITESARLLELDLERKKNILAILFPENKRLQI